MSSRATNWLLGILLIVITIAVYAPSMHNGWIWDDDHYVQQNPTLQDMDGLRTIWMPWTARRHIFPVTAQYYPLVYSSFWIEQHLWGRNPTGYHVVNIVLHAITAVLLWLVLRRLSIRGAWLIAAIFALHPVNVESVAWITERKNVLSAALYMASALTYLGFALPVEATARRRWIMYAAALLLFIASLLSKSVTCSLPAVLLLVLWWKRRKLIAGDILPLIPFFVGGLGLGLLTVWMEKQHVGASGVTWDLTLIERGLLAGRALLFYSGKLLWPTHLLFFYERWNIDQSQWWQYLFPLAVLTIVVLLFALRRRIGYGPLVAFLCFAGTLVPALGFFNVYPFRYSFVADHFQYLASVFFITLIVAGALTIARGIDSRWPAVVATLLVVLLAPLGVLTWRQQAVYKSAEALWLDLIERNPSPWMAHTNLALIRRTEGKLDEAITHLEAAIDIKPDLAEAHTYLGGIHAMRGSVARALELQHKAVALDPNLPEAQNNLGGLLLALGRTPDAIAHLERAVELQPEYLRALNTLGFAYVQAGQPQRAIDIWQRSIDLQPQQTDACGNLAWLRATSPDPAIHDSDAALALALQAVENSPTESPALLDTLAAAHAAGGQFDEAVFTAQRALMLATTHGNHALAADVRKRLDMYRRHEPYVE